jgi:hypothetical protein
MRVIPSRAISRPSLWYLDHGANFPDVSFDVPATTGMWIPWDSSWPQPGAERWGEFVPANPARTEFPDPFLRLKRSGIYLITLAIGANAGEVGMEDVVAQIRPVEVYASFDPGDSSSIYEDAHGARFTPNGIYSGNQPMITIRNVYTTVGQNSDGWAFSGIVANLGASQATVQHPVMTVIPLAHGPIME